MIAVQPFDKKLEIRLLDSANCDKGKSSANAADAIFLDINFSDSETACFRQFLSRQYRSSIPCDGQH